MSVPNSPQAVSVLLNIWAGDDPALLSQALMSVGRQTLVPDELVVVIDGPISTDLRTALRSASSQLQFAVEIQELHSNMGLWFARNIGLEVCQNDIVALHDSDDIMHPRRLERQQMLMRSLEVSVLGSGAFEFDTTNLSIVGARRTVTNRLLTLCDFAVRNPIHHSSVILSRDKVARVGRYRNFPGNEDLDLWRRLLRSGARVANDNHFLQALGTSRALLERRRLTRVVLRSELELVREQLATTLGMCCISSGLGFLSRVVYRSLPTKLKIASQQKFLRQHYADQPLTLSEFLLSEPFSSR